MAGTLGPTRGGEVMKMKILKMVLLQVAALVLAPILGAAQPVEVLPPELRGAIQPQVAVAPNGNIYVTFGKGTSVYCAVSTNGGKAFLQPVEVARLPKLALGMRRGPRITASNRQITISAVSHG